MRQYSIGLSVAILLGSVAAMPAAGQDSPVHFPLDDRAPVGIAARWNVIAQRGIYGFPQPIEVSLPSQGRVTFVERSTLEGVTVDAPAKARLMVGHTCRVKISDMPEFPGVELYPTIELLDRLHAPPQLAGEFAVPVELTAEEIEAVLHDRMVTKVIYLERQDLPRPNPQEAGVHITDFVPSVNLLQSATQMGHPVAILRIGGRTPAPNAPDDLLPPFAPVEVISSPSAQP
jgi:hypothetical protein